MLNKLDKASEQERNEFVTLVSQRDSSPLTINWNTKGGQMKVSINEANRNSKWQVGIDNWRKSLINNNIITFDNEDKKLKLNTSPEMVERMTEVVKRIEKYQGEAYNLTLKIYGYQQIKIEDTTPKATSASLGKVNTGVKGTDVTITSIPKSEFIQDIKFVFESFGIYLSDATINDIANERLLDSGKTPIGYNSGTNSTADYSFFRSDIFFDAKKQEGLYVFAKDISLSKATTLEAEAFEENKFLGQTDFMNLAKLEAKNNKTIHSSSFYAGNKMLNAFDTIRYIYEIRKKLEDPDFIKNEKERHNALALLPILQDAIKDGDINKQGDFGKFKLEPISPNSMKHEFGSFSNNAELKDLDELSHEMIKLMGYGQLGVKANGKRSSRFLFLTASDKKRGFFVQYEAEPFKLKPVEGIVASEKAINAVYDNIFKPELARILQSSDNPDGQIFYSIPILNEIVDTSLFSLVTKTDENGNETKDILITDDNKEHVATIKALIGNVLEQLTKEKLEEWNRLGIVTYSNDKTHNALIPYHLTKDGSMIEQIAFDYVTNYLIANNNSVWLIGGDPINYVKKHLTQEQINTTDKDKRKEIISKHIATTRGNFTKRLGGLVGPRTTGNTDVYETQEVRTIILEDYYDDLNKYTPYYKEQGLNKPYSGVNRADAQEYISIDYIANMLFSYGRMSKEQHTSILNKYESGEYNFTNKELKLLRQPLKPLTFTRLENGNVIYKKTSAVKLIPGRSKQFNQLIEFMRKNNIQSATYQSGLKSAPVPTAKWLDENGNFILDQTFNKDKHVIVTKPFDTGIQQDVPYKEDAKILDPSQKRALLFNGTLDYDFNGIKGSDLKNKHDKLYGQLYENAKYELLNELDAEVTEVNGVVDYKISPSNLHRVIQKQASQMGLTKQEKAMLSITGIDFTIPLLFNSASNRIQYVLQSLITNRIIKQKTAGQSSVLVSDVGLSYEDTDIVWTGNYDGSKPLQGARFEDGVFKPAQIILPFKYKGLSLNDFIYTDENGRKFLDTSRFDSELLKGYSVRIPTQLHSSMSMVEIVGFLPETEGDIVYAASAFIMQMGSDFDIDKLYSVLNEYQTELIVDNKSEQEFKDYYEEFNDLQPLTKKQYHERLKSQGVIYKNDKYYKKALVKFKPTFEISDFNLGYNDELALFDKIARKKFIDNQIAIANQQERITKRKKNNPDYTEKPYKATTYNKELASVKYKFRKEKKAYLQNELNQIYFTVLSHKEVVKEMIKPTDATVLKRMRNSITDSNVKTEFILPDKKVYEDIFISDMYQKDKYLGGKDGKTGIGAFSAFSVLLAQLEGTGTQLNKTYNIGFKHLKLSNDISNPRNYNNDLKLRVNGEFQNASVDNANDQLLDTFNISNESFATIQALTAMGANVETIIYLINHPRIKELFELTAKSKGEFGDGKYLNYVAKQLIEDIKDKSGLSKTEFTSEKLKEAKQIINDEFDENNLFELSTIDPLTQRGKYSNQKVKPDVVDVVLLQWISELNEIGTQIMNLAKAFNADSKGSGLTITDSIEINALKEEFLTTEKPFFTIDGIEKLNEGLKGLASHHSVDFSTEIYKDFFPYDELNDLMKVIFDTIKPNSTQKKSNLRKLVVKELYAYHLSYIPGFIENPTKERNKLFKDIVTKTGVKQHSIAAIVLEAQKHPSIKNNTFLSELNANMQMGEKPANVTFRGLRQTTGSEMNYVSSIIELLMDDETIIGTFNHQVVEKGEFKTKSEQYTPKMLMLDLIKTELLRGNPGGGISYHKHIPMEIYNMLGINNVLKKAFKDLKSGDFKKEQEIFFKQLLRNNASLATSINSKHKGSITRGVYNNLENPLSEEDYIVLISPIDNRDGEDVGTYHSYDKQNTVITNKYIYEYDRKAPSRTRLYEFVKLLSDENPNKKSESFVYRRISTAGSKHYSEYNKTRDNEFSYLFANNAKNTQERIIDQRATQYGHPAQLVGIMNDKEEFIDDSIHNAFAYILNNSNDKLQKGLVSTLATLNLSKIKIEFVDNLIVKYKEDKEIKEKKAEGAYYPKSNIIKIDKELTKDINKLIQVLLEETLHYVTSKYITEQINLGDNASIYVKQLLTIQSILKDIVQQNKDNVFTEQDIKVLNHTVGNPKELFRLFRTDDSNQAAHDKLIRIMKETTYRKLSLFSRFKQVIKDILSAMGFKFDNKLYSAYIESIFGVLQESPFGYTEAYEVDENSHKEPDIDIEEYVSNEPLPDYTGENDIPNGEGDQDFNNVFLNEKTSKIEEKEFDDSTVNYEEDEGKVIGNQSLDNFIDKIKELQKQDLGEANEDGFYLSPSFEEESIFERMFNELIKDGEIQYVDEETGKLCAKFGGKTNFHRGGKWELVKDLKNFPTHEKGGVDVSIGTNGVSIKNGDSIIKAEKGLVITGINTNE